MGLTGELLQRSQRPSYRFPCLVPRRSAYGPMARHGCMSLSTITVTRPPWLATPMVGFVAAVMALFFAGIGWLYGRFPPRPLLRLLALPALWVLGEWLRSWLFTGFPWLFTGYAFVDTPLAGYAPATRCLRHQPDRCIHCIGSSAGWLISSSAGLQWQIAATALASRLWTAAHSNGPRPTGETLSVSIVQGNIPQESKWQLEWRDKTLAIYDELSESEWGRDLVIWPEAAIPMFYHEAIPFLDNHSRQGTDRAFCFCDRHSLY
jgi:apolipoprotein N-acyltransferase